MSEARKNMDAQWGERDKILQQIKQQSNAQNVPIIRDDTIDFLSFLLSVRKPKYILEVGTAVGFSAGLMSQFMQEDGHITTIERFDTMARTARANFDALGIQKMVTLIEGDAMEIVPLLTSTYDVIFLDAAKGQYVHLLPHCLRLLAVGGILIADDVFQKGNLTKERLEIPRRQRTIHTRMNTFLSEIQTNPALVTTVIPVGDGLALSHKVYR